MPDMLTCRYKLTGPLTGASGSFLGQVFKEGMTPWQRMTLEDWENRDRVLCRFYSAEREVQVDGGDHEEAPGEVQSKDPDATAGGSAEAADGPADAPAARGGTRRKASP